MSTPVLVGVDPGLTGAIALYRPGIEAATGFDGKAVVPMELMVWDMPQRNVIKGRSKKSTPEIDIAALCALAVTIVVAYGAQRVIIEKVSGRPGQGSGFSFGWNTAAVAAAFIAAGMTPDWVTPAMWKRSIGVPDDKRLATQCAELTFPAYKNLFHVPHKTSKKGVTVARHDRSEAALLAFWGAP